MDGAGRSPFEAAAVASARPSPPASVLTRPLISGAPQLISLCGTSWEATNEMPDEHRRGRQTPVTRGSGMTKAGETSFPTTLPRGHDGGPLSETSVRSPLFPFSSSSSPTTPFQVDRSFPLRDTHEDPVGQGEAEGDDTPLPSWNQDHEIENEKPSFSSSSSVRSSFTMSLERSQEPLPPSPHAHSPPPPLSIMSNRETHDGTRDRRAEESERETKDEEEERGRTLARLLLHREAFGGGKGNPSLSTSACVFRFAHRSLALLSHALKMPLEWVDARRKADARGDFHLSSFSFPPSASSFHGVRGAPLAAHLYCPIPILGLDTVHEKAEGRGGWGDFPTTTAFQTPRKSPVVLHLDLDLPAERIVISAVVAPALPLQDAALLGYVYQLLLQGAILGKNTCGGSIGIVFDEDVLASRPFDDDVEDTAPLGKEEGRQTCFPPFCASSRPPPPSSGFGSSSFHHHHHENVENRKRNGRIVLQSSLFLKYAKENALVGTVADFIEALVKWRTVLQELYDF